MCILSIYLYIYLSFYLPIYLSIYIYLYINIYLYICLPHRTLDSSGSGGSGVRLGMRDMGCRVLRWTVYRSRSGG